MGTEMPAVENTETLGAGDVQTDADTLVIFTSKASIHNNKEGSFSQRRVRFWRWQMVWIMVMKILGISLPL